MAAPKTDPSSAPSRGRRRNNAPTLVDVARVAGVSEMAASTALNGGRRGSARVSVETRERVLVAAQQLGYRPNATARALASQRTNAIGVVTNFLGEEPNLYFLEVFTLGTWEDAPARIPELCDGRVDGLILLAPCLSDDGSTWLPRHTPMVSIHTQQPASGVVNLDSDNEAGAREMVRRLLAAGHRRILHVGGPPALSGARQRVEGYLRAHADAGVEPAPGHLVHAPLSAEGGREALQAWLARHRGEPLPDAVFGCNDAIALGCIEVLRARGLRVPEDISVVGFDNTLAARMVRMTTVRQPLHDMGRRAVQLLMQRIEALQGDEPPPALPGLVLPTDIVEGTTLAAPRAVPLSID
jgi:DNA-binding LacI/PurR family transcriptional regulator